METQHFLMLHGIWRRKGLLLQSLLEKGKDVRELEILGDFAAIESRNISKQLFQGAFCTDISDLSWS